MQTVEKYFPELTADQKKKFQIIKELYPQWNEKINVISRKDITNLEINHVLHSLALARYCGSFKENTRILDFGTGGGFPGIPMAIYYPEVHFVLADRTLKKLRVVQAITQGLGLTNVEIFHGDAKELPKKSFDFVVSRAVTNLQETKSTVGHLISPKQHNHLYNGLLCLKGGDLANELVQFRKLATITPISDFFAEEFFTTKKIIYLPIY